ncbi:MAG: hypothetical protein LBM96_01725 [Methanobrevibacter sp.]|jgi:chromosome segregation ATPase|nr:hypothetical protein [Candidatus Methanoflexus mossambicus]
MSFIRKIKNKIISKSNGYMFYKSNYVSQKKLINDKNNALRDRNNDIEFLKNEIIKKNKTIEELTNQLSDIHTNLNRSNNETSILTNVLDTTMEEYFKETKNDIQLNDIQALSKSTGWKKILVTIIKKMLNF